MEILKWILRIVAFITANLAVFTKWDKKIRISLFIFSIIIISISIFIGTYIIFNPTCYDRYGNEYDSESEVVYYTEDNKKIHI